MINDMWRIGISENIHMKNIPIEPYMFFTFCDETAWKISYILENIINCIKHVRYSGVIIYFLGKTVVHLMQSAFL